MNIASSLRALILPLLLMAALPLGGCSRPVEEPPLAGARIGGPFTLTNQDGVRTSDSQFAGQYRLIYFGYTFCPDICPVDMQHLMKGLRLFEKDAPKIAARVQPLFITVDPARDTPAALKSFVSAFHPRLIGLTGSEAEIAAVAKQYAVYYRKTDPKGAAGYLVDHARQTILFDPDGKPLALIPQDSSPEIIAAELDRWVR